MQPTARTMNRFTRAIQMAIEDKNWYAALSLALIIPDICGKIDQPNVLPKNRYMDWANKWFVPKYTSHIGPDRKEYIFLNAEDCYALRCSYLHAGSENISNEKIRKALEDFHFCEPPKNGNVEHMNQVDNTLQLQIDIFCCDMVSSVESWLKTRGSDYPDNTAHLLTIWPPIFD